MLEPKEIQDAETSWKDVRAGDLVLMEYKRPHLCFVYQREEHLSLVSLTDANLNWTDISGWGRSCSNKLLKIYKKGDTFVIT